MNFFYIFLGIICARSESLLERIRATYIHMIIHVPNKQEKYYNGKEGEFPSIDAPWSLDLSVIIPGIEIYKYYDKDDTLN